MQPKTIHSIFSEAIIIYVFKTITKIGITGTNGTLKQIIMNSKILLE